RLWDRLGAALQRHRPGGLYAADRLRYPEAAPAVRLLLDGQRPGREGQRLRRSDPVSGLHQHLPAGAAPARHGRPQQQRLNPARPYAEPPRKEIESTNQERLSRVPHAAGAFLCSAVQTVFLDALFGQLIDLLVGTDANDDDQHGRFGALEFVDGPQPGGAQLDLTAARQAAAQWLAVAALRGGQRVLTD